MKGRIPVTDSNTPINYMAMVVSLCITIMIAGMNSTIFNIALPALMVYFQCDILTVQWITSGYMLASGIIVPCSAYLGGKFGYKRMLLFLLTVALVAMIAGSVATSIYFLIGIRIILGLTCGLFSPLILGMIYRTVPPHFQPKAASIYGIFGIVGGALPLVIAGVLITFLSWRWLFWLFIPIIAIAAISIYHYVPADDNNTTVPLDVKGLFLTVVGSFILLFAFSNMTKWGIGGKFATFCIIGSLFMAVYVKVSWGKATAMLNLEILRYKRYNIAIIIAVIETVSMYLVTFMMPLFLQKGMGYTPFIAGLIILPMSLVTIFAMPVGTKILTSQGEKTAAVVGLAFLMLGSVFFFRTENGIPLLIIMLAIIIRGIGLAFTNLVTTNTTMSSVPPQLSTHASAFSNWVRQMVGALTTSIGSNIIGIQLLLRHAESEEEIAGAYSASLSIVMIATFIMLAICVVLAWKYFRGKSEMQASMQE